MIDNLDSLSKEDLINILKKIIDKEEVVKDDKPDYIATIKQKRQTQNKTSNKSLCKIENINVAHDRPNLFLEMKTSTGQLISESHKKDSSIDKLLSGNNEISTRGERVGFIEMICDSCGEQQNVPASIAAKYGSDIEYRCDKCLKKEK